ncbi:MAG TPA: hypothetical protein VMM82_07385, partial [Spirochaetia bacterium]|nr:hypothetical protein [Spirochaetia bacterium]
PRTALVLAGSFWEAVRFFVVLSLLAQIFSAGAGIIPWLLLGGSGNLLVAVGAFMLSLFPERYGGLIGFLRLGKLLSVFSFLLLALSGSIGISARAELIRVGPVSFPQASVLFTIFALDLAFLVALVSWKKEKDV